MTAWLSVLVPLLVMFFAGHLVKAIGLIAVVSAALVLIVWMLLPGLFDQCLDQGLEFLAIDRIARTRRARRSGNGHSCLPDSVALVLLASC